MKKRIVLMLMLLAGLHAVSLAEDAEAKMPAAQSSGDGTGPLERAGRAVDNAAKKTGTAVKRAAEKTGEAVGGAARKTGEAVGRGVEKTGKALERAGQKVQEKARSSGETRDADDDKKMPGPRQ